MRSLALRLMLASFVLVALALLVANDAYAQCATCPVSTVAYQPVVAQPTVAFQPYTGWYPGKWLDQWRLRRANVGTTAPAYASAYSAAYAPAYTAAYAPSYTAAYAPAFTAAYRPYASSYAPLSAPVTQAAYYPVAQTLTRQVLLRPVLAAPVCNTCSFTPSCGCDTCATGVSQAAYTEPACSGCAGSAITNVVPQNSSLAPNVGPQTPQPDMSPQPAPLDSRYNSNRQSLEGSGSRESGAAEDEQEADPLEKFLDPSTKEGDSSTYYNTPRLLDPRGDRTARSYKRSHQPTVEVWNAVFQGPAKHRNVSQTQRRASTKPRSRAEIDAKGWTAVPRNR